MVRTLATPRPKTAQDEMENPIRARDAMKEKVHLAMKALGAQGKTRTPAPLSPHHPRPQRTGKPDVFTDR